MEEAALSGVCLLQSMLLNIFDKRFPQFSSLLWECAHLLQFLAKFQRGLNHRRGLLVKHVQRVPYTFNDENSHARVAFAQGGFDVALCLELIPGHISLNWLGRPFVPTGLTRRRR